MSFFSQAAWSEMWNGGLIGYRLCCYGDVWGLREYVIICYIYFVCLQCWCALKVGAILWQDITCPPHQVCCLSCIEHFDPDCVLGCVCWQWSLDGYGYTFVFLSFSMGMFHVMLYLVIELICCWIGICLSMNRKCLLSLVCHRIDDCFLLHQSMFLPMLELSSLCSLLFYILFALCLDFEELER